MIFNNILREINRIRYSHKHYLVLLFLFALLTLITGDGHAAPARQEQIGELAIVGRVIDSQGEPVQEAIITARVFENNELLDEAESQVNNRGILDQTRINGERYPDYHSLNIRADRRFNFNNANLVLYLSIWNVYDRKNIASYFWNGNTNSSDTIYQYGMLPIFGIEYEF